MTPLADLIKRVEGLEAVENITSKSPHREPSPSRTTNDPDDAFDQGYDRAMWDADVIARAALGGM